MASNEKHFLAQISQALRDPVLIFFYMIGRFTPELLFRHYSDLAKRQGLDRLYLLLSFDCDTPEDIAAAEQVHDLLHDMNVKTTFAVPGHLLERGEATYRRLAHQGADFINHGALPHAEQREGRYWSITFYSEMTPQAVREDIRHGHEIVKKVIGQAPVGFRAPHFGLLKRPKDLKIIHAACRELGYLFSASTLPLDAFRHGPVWRTNGLCELPVSGSYSSPLSILDSWSHIISPSQPIIQESYTSRFMQTIDGLLESGSVGVLNYYVDPAHVVGNDLFLRAIKYALGHQVTSINYNDLLMKGYR